MKNKLKSAALMLAMISSAKAAIVINEVDYLNTIGNDRVEIFNNGATAVDISSWWFCSRFSYVQLSGQTLTSGSLNLGAGQIAVLTLSIDLNDVSADFGLFNTNSFGTASAMESFVQWGTATDVGRVDVAVAKGIWSGGPTVYDFVATAGGANTLQYDGSGDGVGNWSNAASSIGVANTVPEPSSAAMLGLGAMLLLRRKRS